MITQLNPPIPLDTPKGKALAHFIIDYGPEHHLMWVTFADASGECWTWPNTKIRAQKNISMGRATAPISVETPMLMHGEKDHSTNGYATANGVETH